MGKVILVASNTVKKAIKEGFGDKADLMLVGYETLLNKSFQICDDVELAHRITFKCLNTDKFASLVNDAYDAGQLIYSKQ